MTTQPDANDTLIQELHSSTEKQEKAMDKLQNTFKETGEKITQSIQDALLSLPRKLQHSDDIAIGSIENKEQADNPKNSSVTVPKITIYILATIAFLLLVNIGINLFNRFLH